ncbi:MAG: hypothetical protein RLZZ396_2568 [Planctomycetota bacterium]|jgi:hypothetical protein
MGPQVSHSTVSPTDRRVIRSHVKTKRETLVIHFKTSKDNQTSS